MIFRGEYRALAGLPMPAINTNMPRLKRVNIPPGEGLEGRGGADTSVTTAGMRQRFLLSIHSGYVVAISLTQTNSWPASCMLLH